MCVKRMSSRSCLGRFSQFAIPTLIEMFFLLLVVNMAGGGLWCVL